MILLSMKSILRAGVSLLCDRKHEKILRTTVAKNVNSSSQFSSIGLIL